MYFSYLIILFAYNIQIKCSQLSNNDTDCTLYKDVFGRAVSQFTSCAINYSKPIKLCQLCVDQYIDVLHAYHNLSLVFNKTKPCIDMYINLDRLEVMKSLYRNNFDLWNRAKCYECFEIVNNVLTHNRSKETNQFNALYSAATQCINKNDTNKTNICVECIEPYLELNEFYNSISNENEKIPVCMDIVDMMNGTRSFWSDKCCTYRHHTEYMFLASTGCMFLFTIAFYILTKLCTDKKSAAIYLQSRFAESLNHLNT